MAGLDWVVLGAYMAGMIGMSLFLSRGQASTDDYYVGGRNLPWWAVGVSTMATQTSANSFISLPAFVAMREGGGLTWLQYELAVPLAMIFILIPVNGPAILSRAAHCRSGTSGAGWTMTILSTNGHAPLIERDVALVRHPLAATSHRIALLPWNSTLVGFEI